MPFRLSSRKKKFKRLTFSKINERWRVMPLIRLSQQCSSLHMYMVIIQILLFHFWCIFNPGNVMWFAITMIPMCDMLSQYVSFLSYLYSVFCNPNQLGSTWTRPFFDMKGLGIVLPHWYIVIFLLYTAFGEMNCLNLESKCYASVLNNWSQRAVCDQGKSTITLILIVNPNVQYVITVQVLVLWSY